LFFRGIKEYYKEFRHSNVTTGDFKSVMSKVTGRELDSLFRQWLYQPGLPD
jgi:aminopeptidase N